MYIYKYKRNALDDNSTIVYIGKTKDIDERHRKHLESDDWCNEYTFELFYAIVDEKYIDDIEKTLIRKYRPVYNDIQYKNYKPTYETNERVYLHYLNWKKYDYD